ncbi:PASTA domain-containing protein [Porphyromonas sp. COT-239 OH1446]|uniref:PASTA domain-containing protein n=1 Tax=Porphyromonas sp. COT-239 OH1446 TaxID=1515613 RepID=UPI00068A24D9|nr:PASTA domain-containing protein [Porphyromonas sp. COT-239 OH1446]
MKKNSILFNLLLMLLLSSVLLWGIIWGLKVYTKHHINIPIPEVRGKTLEQTSLILSSSNLFYEVVDSVYSREAVPGTVFDVIPAPGHEVKPGRTIFVKIYSSQQRRVALPYVKDMSARQALALLRGLGFERVDQRIVSGPYINLAQGFELRNGQPLKAGDMLSIDTPIVLLVVGNVADTLPPVEGLIEDENATWTPEETPTKKAEEEPEPNEWW